MTDPESDRTSSLSESGHPSRSPATRIMLALCGVILFAGFIFLGTWQLQRLQWKEALISRVEERIHASPVNAPDFSQWPHINADNSEYRRVQATGFFLHESSVRVQASTRLGSGYWVMTPLHLPDGTTILVNRGFIPQGGAIGASEPYRKADQAVTVTGLLRMSEPKGGFLRDNDPGNDRWYSRDVAAIAAARGLTKVAPYFIDADAAPPTGDSKAASLPIGGLTVVSFPNSHLVYALTWYALALMTAGAGIWIAREGHRRRHASEAKTPLDSTGK